jgi:hypothetical protein
MSEASRRRGEGSSEATPRSVAAGAAPTGRIWAVGRPRRPASPAADQRSYGLLLAFVVAGFLFAALEPNASWSTSLLVLLQAATLVCALWTVGLAEPRSLPSVSIAAVAVAAAVANLALAGHAASGAVGLLSASLTLATAFAVAVGVIDQGEVNRDSIRGAICVYVLLGMIFVFLYSTAAELGSGPFFAQGTDGTRAVRTYFSYVTLATLGYGDYTPVGTLGRTLAICEALLGQIYLVTVVALLVARLGQRREPRLPSDG